MAAASIRELETLKSICNHLQDAVYVVDLDYQLLWVNRAYRQMFRYRERPVRKCSEHAQFDTCSTNCVLAECIKTKEYARWNETFTRNGRHGDLAVQTSGSALLDDDGNVAGAIGFVRDVSVEVQLHQRSRELRAVNTEMRDVLDHIQQGICTLDAELRVNPQYSRYMRQLFPSAQLAGAQFPELILPRPADDMARGRLADWLRLVFAQPMLPWDIVSQLVDREVVHRAPESTAEKQFVLDFVPIRDEEQIVKIMILIEDVTAERALRAEVARKARENQDDIAQIAEIIALDPEIFDQFLDEARELVDIARQEARQLSNRPAGEQRATIDSLFRQIHTLKGNARSFKLNLIAARAHEVEDMLAALRDGARELDDDARAQTDSLMLALDELVSRAATLRDRVSKRHLELDLGGTRGARRQVFVRTEAQKVRELEAAVAALKARLAGAPDSAVPNIPALERDLTELADQVARLTHVPFSMLLPRLHRVVIDLAVALGKKLNGLVVEGKTELQMDAGALNAIADPMIHLIRNAIDHGVELPEQRIAAGKPDAATVTLRVRSDDPAWVCFEVIDDGAGIDPARVLDKAQTAGLVSAEQARALGHAQIVDLIFSPGFSTARAVTEISGRGVGLDVVRDAAQALQGSVEVESTPGAGCRFTLRVPADMLVRGPAESSPAASPTRNATTAGR